MTDQQSTKLIRTSYREKILLSSPVLCIIEFGLNYFNCNSSLIQLLLWIEGENCHEVTTGLCTKKYSLMILKINQDCYSVTLSKMSQTAMF